MNQLLSFHNDKKIKAKYLNRLKAHAAADEIIHGTYWEKGKGCAVGCTVEKSTDAHQAMEDELGIPRILAHIEDVLFEEMKNGHAKEFPIKFLDAIPVGVDLSNVFPKLVIWEWEDPEYGLKNIKEIQEDKDLVQVCEDLVTLYKRKLEGEEITDKEWDDIGARAWARAGAWAWAWAWAWARARAWAGAWAGARAGARARAWADFEEEYNKQILITANKLIELLKEA